MKFVIDKRRVQWHKFLRSISLRTNTLFNTFLSQKGCSGQLVFNHETGTLDIKVFEFFLLC